MPEGYEAALVNQVVKDECQFKKLGVRDKDKMQFFLLKWIFNAIMHKAEKQKGQLIQPEDFIFKQDLIEQLN